MRFIAENVVENTPKGTVLYGGKSKETGDIIFPYPQGAESSRYDRVKLKSEGRLWSYTVQRFPPKDPPFIGPNKPDTFRPFAVGYVELEDEVIVETRIKTNDFDVLKVGIPMQLTTIAFAEDSEGLELYTYAFEPSEGE